MPYKSGAGEPRFKSTTWDERRRGLHTMRRMWDLSRAPPLDKDTPLTYDSAAALLSIQEVSRGFLLGD